MFFLVVIASVIAAHLLSRPLLRARRFAESALGIPAVSVTAALGATLALVSMLPVVDVGLFYVSGLAGACLRVDHRHLGVDHPRFAARERLVPTSIRRSWWPSCAIFCSAASARSRTRSRRVPFALPLVTIACIIRAAKPADEGDAPALGEGRRRCSAGGGCSGVRHRLQRDRVLGGAQNDVLSSGLNYMVLFEVLAVILMAFCCWLMSRFSQQRGALSPRGTAVLSFCVCYLPLFSIGLVMGGAAIPSNAPDALWESNVWVLLIAIFAYDIRDSVYAIRGLAVGLMFEAMCIGQLIARVSTLSFSCALAVAGALTALYFFSVGGQLLRGVPKRKRPREEERQVEGRGRAPRRRRKARRCRRDAGVLPQARAGERLDAAGGRDTRLIAMGAARSTSPRS
ncbi:MAG: hypothetical protein ACLSVD_04275 [Eggerthellaceae bacterium]